MFEGKVRGKLIKSENNGISAVLDQFLLYTAMFTNILD